MSERHERSAALAILKLPSLSIVRHESPGRLPQNQDNSLYPFKIHICEVAQIILPAAVRFNSRVKCP